MAEEDKSGFRNTRLLLVAAGLGILFLILFNFQRAVESRARTADMRHLVLIKGDLQPGNVVDENAVETVPMSAKDVERLKGFVTHEEMKEQGRFGVDTVRLPVAGNTYLQWDHLGVVRTDTGPNTSIPEGYGAIALEVKSSTVPMPFVNPNTRVNVYGLLSLKGEPADMHLILEAARVGSVGGEAEKAAARRDVRVVTLFLPKPLIEPMLNIQRRAGGPLILEARGVSDAANKDIKHPYIARDSRSDWYQWGSKFPPEIDEFLKRPFTPAGNVVGLEESPITPG